jgi:hypothetical protein
MNEQEKQRFKQITKNVPQLFDFGGGKELLYIGASPSRFQFGEELIRCGYNVTILEAWAKNALHYTTRRDLRVDIGDVSQFETLKGRRCDVTFWWHGPEHITRSKLPTVLQEVEWITSKLVVLGCPWGEYKQGEYGGNPYEKHLSTLDKDFFVDLGYNVSTVGEKDVPNKNNLLAWKEMKE